MRAHGATLFRLFLLGLSLAVGVAAAAPAPDEVPIMPLSEVQRGMTGYGLTCLGKDQPEKFNVEVLGVLSGVFPKGSIIMIRMSGPVINEAGGFEGMSGSPVYVNDKLLGAVAYGWAFAKVPLGGVTPAEEMLKVRSLEALSSPGAEAAAKARSRQVMHGRMADLARMLMPGKGPAPDAAVVRQALLRASVPPIFSDAYRTAVPLDVAGIMGSALPGGTMAQMQPLPIPLSVGGALGGGLLSPLSEAGFAPVREAPAAGQPQPADKLQGEIKLEPGMPIGTVFVSGDVDLSGMGTLTWVKGNQVLAFGHPMFGAGDVDFPLVLGRSPIIVPSLETSFRLTNSGPIVGCVTQDRDAAILGDLSRKPAMFPCTVRIRGVANDEYHYQVTGFWETAPFFTHLVVEMSSQRWQGEGNPYNLTAKAQITLKGMDKPLVLQNEYAEYSVVGPAADLLMTPLSELMTNPFRKVEISQVDFDLDVRPGREAAMIEALDLDRPQAAPGSQVTLYVRLKPFRGESVVKEVPLRIPDTATPGTTANILVADAAAARVIDRDFDPGFYDPQSFDDLVQVLQKMDSNRSLVVRAAFVDRGLRYAGSAMPALPSSALSILEFNRGGGRTTPLMNDVRFTVPTPWVLQGSQMVSIAIKEPEPLNP